MFRRLRSVRFFSKLTSLVVSAIAICAIFNHTVTWRRLWHELNCLEIVSEKTRPPLTPRARHLGCSRATPVVRYPQCPKCFSPSVVAWSRTLVRIDEADRVNPRGTPGYFRTREVRQQDLVDGVLIAPWSVCTDSCPYLVAIQLTTLEMSDDRKTTRLTWASPSKTGIWPNRNLNSEIKIVFVVAHQTPEAADASGEIDRGLPSKNQWRRLVAESDVHGDILYLDMMDSYPNLTLKVMSSLKWLTAHCLETKFFLKVDIDTFVNVPLLLDLLIYNEETLAYSILGHLYNDTRKVERKGRWAVDRKIYPMAMYPIYAAGCAYLISSDVASAIVALSPYMPMLPIEDAYVTGIMAMVVKAEMYAQNDLFTHFWDPAWKQCQMVLDTKLTGTSVGGDRALGIWSAIVTMNATCTRESLGHLAKQQYDQVNEDYD